MNMPKNNPREGGAWHGDLPVTSRYTFGLAGERFYRAIKDEGKLFGTRCDKCERTYVPASLFCERCMHELDTWIDVGISGEVHTFTLLYEDLDGNRKKTPEIIAFIQSACASKQYSRLRLNVKDQFRISAISDL
jgi:uncharacterized OB-fold protein